MNRIEGRNSLFSFEKNCKKILYMKILLTNDDGYNAEGILLLRDKLAKYGDVTVVAPFEHMSAKSASITVDKWVKLDQIDEKTFALHGTPTDCAVFALSEIDRDFDLVVSGCNNGPNLSYDVLLSGTVGACFGAMVFNKKTVAFSAPHGDFSCLIEHFDEVWEFINKHNLLSTEYCLNINFPRASFKGIKLGRVYYRKDYYYFDKKDDTYYALRDLQDYKEIPEDADCRQVKEGYVSIAPLSRLPFNEEQYQELVKKVQDQ